MIYTFKDCVLDTDSHSLTKSGELRSIEPMVFDLLHLLIRNHGSLVTKEQMIDEIWGGRVVSESAISARIAAVRKAVGDDGKNQTFIKTVARRGLQFIAELTDDGPENTTSKSRPIIKYATANDGVKLAYAVSGSGPPVFRIQHFPTHLELEYADETERAIFDVFDDQFTLIRYDQRGAGLSDIDVEGVGEADANIGDIKAVADATGLNKFAIYGTSSGARVAIQFAVKYPERVSHLVLLGGFVDGRSRRLDKNDPNSPEIIETLLREGWETPNSAYIKAYVSIYFPTASTALIDYFASMLQLSTNAKNVLQTRKLTNNSTISDILHKVSAPTLVMSSRDDQVHPQLEAQKLARGIPNAELVMLDSSNHYPLPSENAWQVQVDAIKEFLNRT